MLEDIARKMYFQYKAWKQNSGKYKGYHLASCGESMKLFAAWIKKWSSLEVKNIFEIGANFAQDAEFLMQSFGISPENVYVFEAHPELYKAIQKLHQFNAFNNAVFNCNKAMTFNIVPLNSQNTGLSSLHKLKTGGTTEVTVQAIRMDDFMHKHGIGSIDFLKLDVEGVTYEVLEGFGERLRDVNAVHLEAEHCVCYETTWGGGD